MKSRIIYLILFIFLISYDVYPKEYHVSVNRNDKNSGSSSQPFSTISAAARIAQPGDEIIVHEGTYREWVNPAYGGTKDFKRIIYQASPGEKVILKGWEAIKHWEKLGKGVWKITLKNSFFGEYNPYQDIIKGDWFVDKGRIHHTGEVYLNGKSFYEIDSLEKVKYPIPLKDALDEKGSTFQWYLQLLNELDRLDIRKNTIIVLWGDHGWHLGDHGLWNKHTNFEQATHTLLMMSVPGKKPGIKPVAMCELVEIFPTLCDLTNLEIPNYLDGVSLVPAINNPTADIKEYAFSQYPREKDKMGYSIRTKRFRYTEWLSENFRTNKIYDPKLVVACEMYDYDKDPLETENVLNKPEYQKNKIKMEQLFKECMLREFKGCTKYSKIADFRKPINAETKKLKKQMEIRK